MIEAYIAASVGASLLIVRLFPRNQDQLMREAPCDMASPTQWPKVSVIVPARNEERNLPRLLASLTRLDYPNLEVIVLDDRSEDATFNVAQSFANICVLNGTHRPPDWTGKNWACYQATLAASGDFLLFTDADTIHRRDSIKRAVAAMGQTQADLLTCLPYHLSPCFWEKLMGPFHMLLFAMTAPYARPKPRRVFAIGQYLLFDAKAYREIGGHAAIKGELVDDLALARTVIQAGKCHHVYRGAPLFEVRMYESLGDFIAGWRRNFRLGFSYSHPLSGLEATLMIMALTGAGHLGASVVTTFIAGLCLIFMLWRQKTLGEFSPLGVLMLPFSLLLFCLSAGLAVSDVVRQKKLSWKGRDYEILRQGARIVRD